MSNPSERQTLGASTRRSLSFVDESELQFGRGASKQTAGVFLNDDGRIGNPSYAMMPSRLESPLLVVDAGNTRIKFGVYDAAESDGSRLPTCHEFTAVPCDAELPWSMLGEWGGRGLCGFITGSNPPMVERVRREWPGEGRDPCVLTDRESFPIRLDVRFPEKVGIDRLLNAVAANRIRPPGRPAIIVDSGTATTVDAVSAEGVFLGGAILPGVELSAKALHGYTALLPEIARSDLSNDPPVPIGRDTESALRSGIYWGQLGAVNELVTRVAHTLEDRSPPECCLLLTGGAAPLLWPQLAIEFRFEPALPMHGLAITAMQILRAERSGGSLG